jgi:hypothetical protein
MTMSKEWMEKKEFDVINIIEDAITSLILQGMKRDGALSLLMVQAAIRMEDNAKLRKILKSIEDGIVDGDDDDDGDDDPRGREAA